MIVIVEEFKFEAIAENAIISTFDGDGLSVGGYRSNLGRLVR